MNSKLKKLPSWIQAIKLSIILFKTKQNLQKLDLHVHLMILKWSFVLESYTLWTLTLQILIQNVALKKSFKISRHCKWSLCLNKASLSTFYCSLRKSAAQLISQITNVCLMHIPMLFLWAYVYTEIWRYYRKLRVDKVRYITETAFFLIVSIPCQQRGIVWAGPNPSRESDH